MSAAIWKGRFGLGLLCAFGATMLWANQAGAGTIEFFGNVDDSTEGLGDYTGSMEYTTDIFSGYGMLDISLANTSDPSNGGYITGFVFNINSSDASASAELLSGASHPFANLSGGGLDAAPFGTFDAGAALGGDFLGGGNPTSGIAVGEMGSFQFKIEASDFLSLTVDDFFTEDGFIARFRGFDDEGSDKVPGTVVPLPMPVMLGAAGLLLVAGVRRRYAQA